MNEVVPEAAGLLKVGAENNDRRFFGHPRGLLYLVLMEGFERFSYFGMQALLVLYMTGRLFKPGVIDHVIGFAPFRAGMESVFGPMTLQALALQIFGFYGGLVYMLPVFGGFLGDGLLGRRRAIILGLVMMAFGHLLMAMEPMFLFALLALLCGSALLKGNVAAQVGGLYGEGDGRRDQGFSIFLMSSNTGAVLAPLVCGTLGELYGWHYGFGAAAGVVLVGLAIYLATNRYLPADPPRPARSGHTEAVPALGPGDAQRVLILVLVILMAAFFWVAQSQIWSAYPLWVRDRVDRTLLGAVMPVTWFQSVDSLGTVLFGPVVLWIWMRQQARGTEPGDFTKIFYGALGFAASEALIAVGELTAGAGKVWIGFALSFHMLSAIGWLFFAPVVLAAVARLAPARFKATAIAGYSFSVFLGSTVSGWLGRFYGVWPNWQFWGLHAGFAVVCGLISLGMIGLVPGLLRGAEGRSEAPASA